MPPFRPNRSRSPATIIPLCAGDNYRRSTPTLRFSRLGVGRLIWFCLQRRPARKRTAPMTGVHLTRYRLQTEAPLAPSLLFRPSSRGDTRDGTPRHSFPQMLLDQRRSPGAYVDRLVSTGDSATVRHHQTVERTTPPLH